MSPSMSNTIVRPSGETSTDVHVPSSVSNSMLRSGPRLGAALLRAVSAGAGCWRARSASAALTTKTAPSVSARIRVRTRPRMTMSLRETGPLPVCCTGSPLNAGCQPTGARAGTGCGPHTCGPPSLTSGRTRARAPHRPHLPALASPAVEPIATIGLEHRHAHALGHLEALEHFAGPRVDSPNVILVAFPRAVPELSVHPGDSGDEAVGLDRAQDLPGVGIDLMDLPTAIMPDPEHPLGPREPRVAPAAGRRDGGEHAAGLRIDLLNAILGELIEMPAIEGSPGIRGDVDRALHLAACRIDGVQLVARRKPDVLPVVCDAVHLVGARERPVFLDDLGC